MIDTRKPAGFHLPADALHRMENAKEEKMAVYSESRGRTSEVEPFGLLTEGAAGIAVIVLAIVALAGVSAVVLASIAAIVIGVGLTVQAFNSAAEEARLMGVSAQDATLGGEVMVDCMCGFTGIVLGILALVGINAGHLLAPALIVFGGALLLSGFISMWPRTMPIASSGAEPHIVAYRTSPAAGLEILTGLAAIVLGILSVIMAPFGVLVLVGFLVVGAALLMVSASFVGATLRLFATT
jgi:hypothetical protein